MIYHVSKLKMYDKGQFNAGGVEQFSSYLQQAIPELKLLSWSDYPDWIREQDKSDYEKAQVLNNWALKQGILGKDSTVITDGYWGLGLERKVDRLISVVHGTLWGRFIQSQIYPWEEVVDMLEVEAQQEMWRNCEVVAVAKEGMIELEKQGLEGHKLIYHGIPLDVYKPVKTRKKTLMHAATSARKGRDIFETMGNLGWHIPFMDEKSGNVKKKVKRINQASCLIAPTRHEGNAYVLIEFLACDVPLITYTTGLACEMDERCGFVTDDLHPMNFIRLIEKLDDTKFSPRQWAEEMCGFDAFAAEWRKYLDLN